MALHSNFEEIACALAKLLSKNISKGCSISSKYEASLIRPSQQITKIIKEESERAGIDPALSLAIIWQESRLNPKAISKDRTCCGLMQIKTTIKGRLSCKTHLENTRLSIREGLKIFNEFKRYAKENIELALMYYNGGFKPNERSKKYSRDVVRLYNQIKRILR